MILIKTRCRPIGHGDLKVNPNTPEPALLLGLAGQNVTYRSGSANAGFWQQRAELGTLLEAPRLRPRCRCGRFLSTKAESTANGVRVAQYRHCRACSLEYRQAQV